MEAYAAALTYAIPFFIILIVIEAIADRFIGLGVNNGMDTISSLSSGMTNTLRELVGLSIVILSYDWMQSQFALFEIKSSFWLYLLCFIGVDFASYWSHRFNHEVNLLWNRHVIHHSSEEYNLACALRQSISDLFVIYFFLYIPLAIIGIPTIVLAIVSPIHLFAQFWYHTRLIGKMGFLEHIIVTPSHHRVHHAINKEYLNKNYSTILIIWDKLFGTFQEELKEVEPVYGTVKPAHTWNPILINFMHLWGLLQDAWCTKNWGDKIRVFFKPIGWRPADVKAKHPRKKVKNVYDRPKYAPPASRLLLYWSWFQLILHVGLIYYVLHNFPTISYLELVVFVSISFISIFAYTTLMDGHWLAVPIEGVKLILALLFIQYYGGWMQMQTYFEFSTLLMVLYFVLSFLLTCYISYFEQKNFQQRNDNRHQTVISGE